MENFTKNLQTAMNRKNYSRHDMAGLMGIRKEEFDLYADGIVTPDPATITKIADKLNVTVGDLGGDKLLTFSTMGEELRRLREANGFKINEAAMLVGIAPSVLSNIERGITKTLARQTREKFFKAYGDDYKKIERKYFDPSAAEDIISRRHNPVVIKPICDTDREEGKRIKEIIDSRLAKIGMTLDEFASKADISKTTLSRIRLYGYRPTPELAERISKILDCEIKGTVKPPTPAAPTVTVVTETPKATKEVKPTIDLISDFGLLDFIEDDAEYRAAVKELVKYLSGGEVTKTGKPQADLVLKMVQSRKAG